MSQDGVRETVISMRVVVDNARCTGLGVCEALAPDLFEVGEDRSLTVLKDSLGDADREAAQDAVEGCPTEALRLEET